VRTVALALLVVAAVCRAEPWAPGTTLPALALDDQHGARAVVDERVRVVVFSHDMKGGDVVREALAEVDQRFLDERRVVYVADISGMPGLIARLVAVPRMRGRRYRMLLDRDGDATHDVPRVDDAPTLVFVEGGRVTRVEHPRDPAALRAALGDPPAH
jgi:hypothetical protein